MEIQCAFKYSDKLYGCFIENHQIPDDKELQLVGAHGQEETNNDVTLLHIANCTMPVFSKEFIKIFPNLKNLEVKNSKLMNLSKNDLVDFKKLEKIDCRENQLEYLSGDLFDGLKNLERIGFFGNKLKVIEPNILDGLEKLKYAEFRKNTNYDTGTECRELRYIKDELYIKFFTLQSPVIKNFFKKFNPSINDIKRYANLCNNNVTKIWELQLEHHREIYAQNIQVMKKTETILRKKIQNFENFGENLLLDLNAFLEDEDTKDFKIVIDGHEFPVHKFLLAARSPTVAEILKNNPEVENLNLVDISVEIFEKILKFLYTDELPGDDGTNFLHLFAAAGKLKIKKLQNFAAMNLMNNIEGENSLEIFKLSHKYEDNNLRLKAFEKVKEEYPKINFKDEWAVDPDKVYKIVEMYMKKEEVMRKIEEEFQKSVIKEFEEHLEV